MCLISEKLGQYHTCWCHGFNLLRPGDAYMHCIICWTILTLVQIIVCCLDGTKPLSKPMLTYCQLGCQGTIRIKIHKLSLKIIHKKISVKWRPSCLGLNVLRGAKLSTGIMLNVQDRGIMALFQYKKTFPVIGIPIIKILFILWWEYLY